MTELLNMLFNPLPNGIMTILMSFSLVYWIFQLLAGDGIDLGTDSDIHFGDINEFDTEVNPESEHEIDTNLEPSFFSKILDFVNVGKVPLMVIVTLFKFISWVITIISTTVLGLAKFGIWSILILIPIFILVFVAMHFITKPLVKFFKQIGYKGEEETDFIGRIGIMKSTIEGDKIGSAEFKINKDVFTLNIKSDSGEIIQFGDTIIITEESKINNYYLVTKYLTLNSIQL